jgi:hypothetical protein
LSQFHQHYQGSGGVKLSANKKSNRIVAYAGESMVWAMESFQLIERAGLILLTDIWSGVEWREKRNQ